MAEVANTPASSPNLFNKENLGPPANGTNAWSIVNGSLYMNAMPLVTSKWYKNLTALIAVTDAWWIAAYGKLHAGPFNTDCLQGHQHEQPSKGKYCRCSTYPQPLPPPMAYE